MSNSYYVDAFLVTKTLSSWYFTLFNKYTCRPRNPKRVLLLLRKDSKTQWHSIMNSQNTLKKGILIYISIGDYTLKITMSKRAQIEELYVKNLTKASKRLYTNEPGILG
jgi:hypothetical protein